MNVRSFSRLTMPAIAVCLLAGMSIAAGSTISTNSPAESITRARIAKLPQAQRGAWLKYLDRSERQRQADKDAFQAELKSAGITTPTEPPHGYSARSIPLDRAASWYAGAEARHIADVLVSFQTPAGGWSKNLDMSKEARRPGERYGPNNESRFLAPGDFDTPKEPDWNYIGTIDNDATITQIEFLAKVTSAAGVKDGVVYRAAFLRGFDYLLVAQFPNGGWPQVYPLEGSYHDAITYNDSAMTQVMDILHHVAEGKDEFAFVPKGVRLRHSPPLLDAPGVEQQFAIVVAPRYADKRPGAQHLDAKLLTQLARQGLQRCLAGFQLATGKFPEPRQVLAGQTLRQQNAAGRIQQQAGHHVHDRWRRGKRRHQALRRYSTMSKS